MQMPTSSTVWWAPGLEIPAAADVEVQPPVAGEQVEHVVEEPDAGVALAAALAVELEGHVNLGLAGLAVDLGGTRHREPLSRMRASIDWAWSSNPSARAIGAAARASSAASSPIRTSAIAPAEVSRRQRRGEPRRPVGRQHVVGAGDVVRRTRSRWPPPPARSRRWSPAAPALRPARRPAGGARARSARRSSARARALRPGPAVPRHRCPSLVLDPRGQRVDQRAARSRSPPRASRARARPGPAGPGPAASGSQSAVGDQHADR